ncbi:MAG: hypothetical protein WBP22_02075 [Candidatus Saccharimonas sp.]
MNTDPAMSLPDEFPPHPKDFREPEQTDLQKLLSAVAAERPVDEKNGGLRFGEIETYDAMYTLSYDVDDMTEVLIAHWGRRIGYMLAGMPFRKNERIHWYFDRDGPDTEAYHVAIETALAKFEQIEGNTEKLQEILHFASPGEFYRIVLRNMIGLSLAEISHWNDRVELRKTGQHVVARVLAEQSDALHEPSPVITHKAGPNRFDPGDLVQLSLGEIMNENGEVLSIGVEDEHNPYYMALVRIAAMTRKMADEEYDSFGSFKDFCGTIAHQLSDKDSKETRRVVHNARFAAFIVAGVNYSKRHWQVRQHAIDNKTYLPHELVDVADAAIGYVKNEKLLANRLEVFLPFIASNETDMILARRVACLTLEQIAKWRVYQMLEQDGFRD